MANNQPQSDRQASNSPEEKLRINMLILEGDDEDIARKTFLDTMVDIDPEKEDFYDTDGSSSSADSGEYDIHMMKPTRLIIQNIKDDISKTAVLYEAACVAYQRGLSHIMIPRLHTKRNVYYSTPSTHCNHRYVFLWLKDEYGAAEFSFQIADIPSMVSMIRRNRIDGNFHFASKPLLDLDRTPFFRDTSFSAHNERANLAQKVCFGRLPPELTLMIQEDLAKFEMPKDLLEYEYKSLCPSEAPNTEIEIIHVYSLIPLEDTEIKTITDTLNANVQRYPGLIPVNGSNSSTIVRFRVHPWTQPYPATRRHVLSIFRENPAFREFLDYPCDAVVFLCQKPWSKSLKLVVGVLHTSGGLYLQPATISAVVEQLFLRGGWDLRMDVWDLATEIIPTLQYG